MANQEATPGSQSEESNALDLPSAYDIRDYVLQRPSQEANSEAFSSEEAFSIPCSSDTDPGRSHCLGEKNILSKQNCWERLQRTASLVEPGQGAVSWRPCCLSPFLISIQIHLEAGSTWFTGRG
ncbi:shieldin complex subunit 1 isoform X3 [Orcinus orca]|uniref:shieldin complex subunit 1 isoform X3 n=1 Tax=Orcinus orca TaxID=9733 RepID=UPI0014421ED5|nr:shieldin complex subunit 1 isoform X3 [Orcinus orca]